MIRWHDVAKKSASTFYHSAQAQDAVEKVCKDINRACRIMAGSKKDEVWSGFFRDLSKEYNQLIKKEKELLIAEVVVALPLDEEDRERLQKALRNFTKTKVEIKEKIDPDIIGGILVKLGDKVFDESIVHQLLAKEYNQLVKKKEALMIAEIVVALPLDEEDRERLQKALRNFTQAEVEIEEKVDPDIIGGIIIKLGDKVFDDSVVHQLEMIKAKIIEGVGGG